MVLLRLCSGVHFAIAAIDSFHFRRARYFACGHTAATKLMPSLSGSASTREVRAPTLVVPECVSTVTLRVTEVLHNTSHFGPLMAKKP
jgi:hypothetical protein